VEVYPEDLWQDRFSKYKKYKYAIYP